MGPVGRAGRFYFLHPVLTSTLIGGLMGFIVLSPLSMVLEHATHTDIGELGAHVQELFLLKYPDWTILFTALGACIGFMYGYMAKKVHDLQKSLHQREKLALVGQLAAGIAHEINTPLSNISITAENAKMRNREAALGRSLEEISRQVDIASGIVRDLMLYSSPAGVETVHVDVNEILRRTLASIGRERQEEVTIVERYGEQLPDIKGEPNQLRHVFRNIINNAYDAMPDGGRLEVSTQRTTRGEVSIMFRDSGCGIPQGDLPKVFEPFFTTKEPGKGTGLGLSICDSVIRDHKGQIKVSSTVGEGTSVTVLLRG